MAVNANDLNIYEKIARIRRAVEVLDKNKAGYGYRYVTEDAILAKITGLMDRYNLSLIPEIVPGTTRITPYTYSKTKVTKGGTTYSEAVNEILIQSDMVFKWIDNKHPETNVIVPWVLVGQQGDASQSFGSGLTYCTRYFLLKFFNVATPDADPDNWRSQQRKTLEEEDKIICQGLLDEVNNIVQEYLEKSNKSVESRNNVKKFMSNYIRSGNYYDITDPVLASKLLTDSKEYFKAEENAEKVPEPSAAKAKKTETKKTEVKTVTKK